MKFAYILILYQVFVKGSNQFTFLLNSEDTSKISLEFSVDYPVYQIGLKCDNYQSDLWISSNYLNLVVTSEQRQNYKCSDKNFTITLSTDFTQDYVTIKVVNINSSQIIQSFDFINDQSNIQKTALIVNKAITQVLYQAKNDFSLQIAYPSTVYVEILKCPNSESTLNIMQFDQNGLYRNLSRSNNNQFFYDLYNTTNGSIYYRLLQQYYDNPDVFIKYQRVSQQQIQDIQSYTFNQNLQPKADVKGDKIFISFPEFRVNNSEKLELRVSVGYEGSELKDLICGYGDSNIWRQHYSYYVNTYNLTYYEYMNNELVADFPSYLQGNYVIRTTAIVNLGTIQQTIPMKPVQVYRNLYSLSGSLLVHILAPTIISILALFGLIVGGCKYKKKKDLYIQQLQLAQLQQQHQIENPYVEIK